MTTIDSVRPLRSYVLRQGRMTPSQKTALTDYWPLYGLTLPTDVDYYDWRAVFEREAPLVIEIGFGMGGGLIELALKHPHLNFIGIEVHPPGVGRCLHQIHTHQLKNVKLFWADANQVLQKAIAPESVDKMLLLFPDPWPKNRHQKRRIVQADFVNVVASKLKKGGIFHLATDWEPYAEHMFAVLQECTALQNVEEKEKISDPVGRVKTKYEQRGEKYSHKIFDLLYHRR